MDIMNYRMRDMIICLSDEAIDRLSFETTERVWSWFLSEVSTLARQSRDRDLTVIFVKLNLIRALIGACLEAGIESRMKEYFNEISSDPNSRANYLLLYKFVEEVRLTSFFDIDGRLEVSQLADKLNNGGYLILIPEDERQAFFREFILRLHDLYFEEDNRIREVVKEFLSKLKSDPGVDAVTLSRNIDDLIYKLHKMASKWPKENLLSSPDQIDPREE